MAYTLKGDNPISRMKHEKSISRVSSPLNDVDNQVYKNEPKKAYEDQEKPMSDKRIERRQARAAKRSMKAGMPQGEYNYEDDKVNKLLAPSRKASPLNDKTGSKTIGEHMMTPTKHAKHVEKVHARHEDAKARVAEKNKPTK